MPTPTAPVAPHKALETCLLASARENMIASSLQISRLETTIVLQLQNLQGATANSYNSNRALKGLLGILLATPTLLALK
jgi:hypothetical protein